MNKKFVQTHSLVEIDAVAKAIASAINDCEARPWSLNIIGSPLTNSQPFTYTSVLADQIARNLAGSQPKYFSDDNVSIAHGVAWEAWRKTAEPKKLIRLIDGSIARMGCIHDTPIPSLGKFDIDIYENGHRNADIVIDIRAIGFGVSGQADERMEIGITSNVESFMKALDTKLTLPSQTHVLRA